MEPLASLPQREFKGEIIDVVFVLFMLRGDRGGTWRTMHCRLCIYFHGTGQGVCVCGGGGGMLHSTPPTPITGSNYFQRRQCNVLQVPPWHVTQKDNLGPMQLNRKLINAGRESTPLPVSPTRIYSRGGGVGGRGGSVSGRGRRQVKKTFSRQDYFRNSAGSTPPAKGWLFYEVRQ
jgi:hypothetical protein